MPRYRPPDTRTFPRFSGIHTFMHLPHVTDLDGVDVAVAGVPFDTGMTNRAGARFGPTAVRAASVMLRLYNPHQRIRPFDILSAVDMGDLPVVPGYAERSLHSIAGGVEQICRAGAVPLLLGGDHSITLGHLRGVARRHGPVALVQFDSHTDLWESWLGEKFYHGSPMWHAVQEGLLDVSRSIQVGIRGPVYSQDDWDKPARCGIQLLNSDDVRRLGLEGTVQAIKERVDGGPVYLSFDIDFFDPAYAPGTGTPEVGGFTSFEGLALLRGLQGIQIVGCDVVEVLPAYDHAELTAMLGANVAYELLCLIAAARRGQ